VTTITVEGDMAAMSSLQPSYFVRLPHSLLHYVKAGKLSPFDLTVYALIGEQIQRVAGFHATGAEISIRQLASGTCHQRKAIGAAVKRLEAAGFLRVQRKRGCHPVCFIATPGDGEFSTGGVLKTPGVESSRLHSPLIKKSIRYCSQTSRDMIKEFFSLKRGLLS
jgi:hypothetical protein